jgi:hypothetical protein
MTKKPFLEDALIEHFRKSTGWKCKPGSAIETDLTNFVREWTGSTRELDELHSIFCLKNGIKPYRLKPKSDR